jgi:predicted TPR repeat methyltransferase
MKMLRETFRFVGEALMEPVKLLGAFIRDLPETIAANRASFKGQGKVMLAKLKNLSETNYNLGLYHLRRGNIADAMMRFRLALWIKPGQAMAYYQLGRCYLLEERPEKAHASFTQALAADPGCQEAKFMVAAMAEDALPTDIPSSIIEEHFTVLAPQYDIQAEEYNYQSPAYIAREVAAHAAGKEQALHILDLGCGTGLVGQAMKEQLPFAILTGVDINAEMLTRAQAKLFHERPVYRQLIRADMLPYMAEGKAEYEAITASASLHFVRDLTPALRAIHGRLKNNGVFVGTVYKALKTTISMPDNFEFFRFPDKLLHQMLEKAGFVEIQLQEISMRLDQRGWLVVARRTKK